MVARSGLALSAGPALPESVKTISEYVAWARSSPKNAFFATTSAGGTPHFIGVMLARDSGIALSPVHYKGGAPALQDLLGGQIPLSVNPVGEILPYARSGKLRVLATTGAQRSKFLPEIPTLVESGFPQIVVEPWLGFFAPAKTPAETVGRLANAIGEAVKAPDTVQSFEKFGNEASRRHPGDLRRRAQGRARALAADRQGLRLHRGGLVMQGKIALEEHFAVEETLSDSLPFVPPDYQAELKHRLFDFYDKRLGLMDKHGIEMMILSLNAPAIQAIPDPKQGHRPRPARQRPPCRGGSEAAGPLPGFRRACPAGRGWGDQGIPPMY